MDMQPGFDLIPTYHGEQWIGGRLPTTPQSWPAPAKQALVIGSAEAPEVLRDAARAYAAPKPWVWPARPIYFFCDLHADADAFQRGLVASGGIAKTGRQDGDMRLTTAGRRARFVIGGDCFDKGPSNLRLLRLLKQVIDHGADVEILAGNHDLRTLIGIAQAGRQDDPRLAHLFVRMGQKSVPLFLEVLREYDVRPRRGRGSSDKAARARLFPDESWFETYPRAAAGTVTQRQIDKELRRIREKLWEFELRCAKLGLSLSMVEAVVDKCRALFLEPDGEFHWYFQRMQLALREGSFLFVHAGVDDAVAATIRRDGVDGLNQRYRRAMREDLFELYHGPLGNTFRTKYRKIDRPLTEAGVHDMHCAGLYAVVHGHRSTRNGQRAVMRAGLLNFECDATLDCNTRAAQGMDGPGGAVTIFQPNGRVLGISTDFPRVKVFDLASVCRLTTIV
jgi:hypothetical protein